MLIRNNIHLKKVINESIKYVLNEAEGEVSNVEVNDELVDKIENIDSDSDLTSQSKIIKKNNLILSFILNLFSIEFDLDFYKKIGVNIDIQKKAKDIDEKKIGKMLSTWSENLFKNVKDIKGFNSTNNRLKNDLNKMFISWEPLLIISLNSDNFIEFIEENIDNVKYNNIKINSATIQMPTNESVQQIMNQSDFKDFMIDNKLTAEEKSEIYNELMKEESNNFLSGKWSGDSSISWIKNMLTGAATFLFGAEDASFINDIFNGVHELASSGIEKNINLVKQLEKEGGIKNVLNTFMKGDSPGKDAVENVLTSVENILGLKNTSKSEKSNNKNNSFDIFD